MKIQSLTAIATAIIPMGGTLKCNQPDPMQVRRGLQRVYKFTQNADGDFVADVEHEGDLRRFLGIHEGFAPYGDEDRALAEEKYGWSEVPLLEQLEQEAAPSGQPAVVDVFVDDGELDNPGDPGEGTETEDGTPGETPLETTGDLPEVPADDADGDVWLEFGRQLRGVEDPKSKEQLETYARDNYGVDLDRRKGPIVLLKQIGALQKKNAA